MENRWAIGKRRAPGDRPFLCCLIAGIRGAGGRQPSRLARTKHGRHMACTTLLRRRRFRLAVATLRQRRRSGTYALPVLLTLGVIALPCGVGTSGVLAWMVGVLLALICVAGLAEALRGWRRYSAAQAIFLFVGAPAFAVILFLWVNTIGYANVLEPEFGAFGINPDTQSRGNLGNA